MNFERVTSLSLLGKLLEIMKKYVPILLVLLLALLLRLFLLTAVPPGLTHDEANHGREAIGVLDGEFLFYFPLNYGSEPLYSYTVAGSMLLFGENVFALRLVNVLFGVLAIAATYLWSRWAFDERVAWVTAVLLSVSFWPLASSREALRAGMLPFFMLCAVWFFWKILADDNSYKKDQPQRRRERKERRDQSADKSPGIWIKQNWKWIVGFGGSVAVMLHIYLAARVAWLLFPLFLLYLFIWHRVTFRRSWLPTLVGLFLAGLLAIPMFVYVKLNPYVLTRLDMLDGPLQGVRAGNLLPLLQNMGGALLAFVWPGYGDMFLAYNIPGRPVFDGITAVFFLAGVGLCLWRWKRPSYAFILLWFAVGIIPSLITGATANTTRNLAALPAVFLLPSVGFWGVGDGLMRRLPRITPSILRLVAVGWLLLAAIVASYDYFVVWGQSTAVRDAYQQTLAAEVAYLQAEEPTQPVVLSSVYPNIVHDPSIYLLLQNGANWETRWVDARYALVVPNGDGATYLISAATPLHPAFAQFLDKVERVDVAVDDLNPYFDVYTLNQERLDAWLGGGGDSGDTAVSFNNAITLLDAQWVQPQLRPGETAELITVWQINDPTQIGPQVPPLFTTDTVMFTQLLDENGNLFAQRDALEAPSWNWQTGDILIQIHPIPIPAETAVKEYKAIVGFYDRASGQRAVTGRGGDYTAVPNLKVMSDE